MGLREIKAKARRDLHNAMKVPAAYYASVLAAPVLINVRVHTKWTEEGDLKGTNLNYAERETTTPRVVFDRVEFADKGLTLPPPRNGMTIITAEEGYRTGQVEPADGEFSTAEVSPLSPADLAGKALPGDL